MSANADDLIKEIDAAALRPMAHVVTRGLYRHIPLQDDFQKEVVNAFDGGGQPSEMAAFQVALWAKIKSTDVENQGGLRLLVALTRPDEVIDWYLAGFMIQWAREQGIAEHHIIDAFHLRSNGGKPSLFAFPEPAAESDRLKTDNQENGRRSGAPARPVADTDGPAHGAAMNLSMSERSVRLWSIALCAFYGVALGPGLFLSWIGLEWVDDTGRGWRTQAAAAALMAGGFPLALGAAFAVRAALTRSGLTLLAGAAFGLIAMIFYAVFLAWGGGMLI